MAKQRNKVRPGMKTKEMPEHALAPPKAGGGTLGSTQKLRGATDSPGREDTAPRDKNAVLRYCCERLNFAAVLVFRKFAHSNEKLTESKQSQPLAALRQLTTQLDSLEARILGFDPAPVKGGMGPTGTPVKPQPGDFMDEVRRLSEALRSLDSTQLNDEEFKALLGTNT